MLPTVVSRSDGIEQSTEIREASLKRSSTPIDTRDLEPRSAERSGLRIALTSEGTRGDIEPLLSLAERFRERGHEAFLCASPDFAKTAAAKQLEFHAIGRSVRELVLEQAKAVSRRSFTTAAPARRRLPREPRFRRFSFPTCSISTTGPSAFSASESEPRPFDVAGSARTFWPTRSPRHSITSSSPNAPKSGAGACARAWGRTRPLRSSRMAALRKAPAAPPGACKDPTTAMGYGVQWSAGEVLQVGRGERRLTVGGVCPTRL